MQAIGGDPFRHTELVIDYLAQSISIYQLDKSGEQLTPYDFQDFPTAAFPFRFKGHLPVVEASINGTNLSLGLDTGASANLLDPQRGAEVQDRLQAYEVRQLRGLNGKTQTTPSALLEGLTVEQHICQPMRTLFCSLRGLNQNLRGSHINLQGILGYEFLRQFRTAINFEKRMIYLWDQPTVDQLLVRFQSSQPE